MKSSAKLRQLLIAVFILGFLLFNQPLAGIFNEEVIILGMPALLFYLFLVWAVLIAFSAIITIVFFKSKTKNH